MNDLFLGNGVLVFNVLECMAWHAVQDWETHTIGIRPWYVFWKCLETHVWCFHHSFHFGDLLNAIAQQDHMGIKHQW